MNDRIDQLWGQALDLTVPETYTRLSHSQVLKVKQVFAELIVQECADVAWQHTPDTEECEYTHLISEKIKEHFGVEE